MRRALLGLALTLLAGQADAGALTVTVPFHHAGYPGALPAPSVVSAPLDPKTITTGQWSISLSDPDAVLVPLSVSSTPAGVWIGSNLTFDVPYFATKSGRLLLAAPLVDDAVNINSILEFNRDASALPVLDEVFLLNARAHRIWEGRRATLGSIAPSVHDAKLVFWLLQTEATLVQQTHLQIDATVRAAMVWMLKALGDPAQQRFFGVSGVSRDDAVKVLRALEGRDTQLYSLVVNRLGADIGSPDEAVRKEACQRTKAMVAFYQSIRDGTSQPYPGWERHELIASTRLGACTGQAVQLKAQSGSGLEIEDRQLASKLSDKLNALATDYARTSGSSIAVRQALDHAAALKVLSGSLQ